MWVRACVCACAWMGRWVGFADEMPYGTPSGIADIPFLVCVCVCGCVFWSACGCACACVCMCVFSVNEIMCMCQYMWASRLQADTPEGSKGINKRASEQTNVHKSKQANRAKEEREKEGKEQQTDIHKSTNKLSIPNTTNNST